MKKFFKLSADTSDRRWKGREMLREILFDGAGNDVIDELTYGVRGSDLGALRCEFLRQGKVSPIQLLRTLRLFVFPKEVGGAPVKLLSSVQFIPAIESTTKRVFEVMRVMHGLKATNFALSELEPWPSGAKIQTWQSPIAKAFVKPAIDSSKVPDDVHVFRLVDWPGHTHTIVSETGREAFMTWIEVAPELLFDDLLVSK